MINDQQKNYFPVSVLAASFLGPSLSPNEDRPWDEASMPFNCDDLVLKVLGQPMRRAGRFIKMVCSGAMACLKQVPPETLKGRKTGIFLATGLGNSDEILPFVTQVFKHDGGYPSPNQFANSVSNAAAFFLARLCDVKGLILTVSDEELSFESALWLAQSALEAGEIELALVGGCDVYTPTVEEYRERMNVSAGNTRELPVGEGSSWLLIGSESLEKMGGILAVEVGSKTMTPEQFLQSEKYSALKSMAGDTGKSLWLPGFRLKHPEAPAGLQTYDYLKYCGIHPTAAAFGLAHAIVKNPSSLLIHYHCSASGKPAIIVAATK
ncbi:MAG TPA: beta-ketoacyl synthase N-terminal-like domain-containing protein [Smithellaceae bacterium]|nr:beta-ketoacyl synthase N-terminal-like domain-containing protein [Smithellaceae bacterium]